MRAVHIDGGKSVLHAHTGGGVAVDGGLHGDVIAGELIAGFGVVGVGIQRFQLDHDAEVLQLCFDKLSVADMGLLRGVAGETEHARLAVCVQIEAADVRIGITGGDHVLLRLFQILMERLRLLVARRYGRYEAAIGI